MAEEPGRGTAAQHAEGSEGAEREQELPGNVPDVCPSSQTTLLTARSAVSPHLVTAGSA